MSHRTTPAPVPKFPATAKLHPSAVRPDGRRVRPWPIVPTVSAAVFCLPMAAARPAAAGVTLVSRDSDIRSAGGAGLDGHAEATGFDTLSDQVGNPDAPLAGRTAVAHQYSVVGRLGDSGAGLEGAFGEGQVRAQTASGAAAVAAVSGFDLTFKVDGVPSAFVFGGSLGAAGGGSAVVSLAPVVASGTSIFDLAIAPNEGGAAGAAHELERSGFLAPGQYVLHVRADGQDPVGGGAESNAYYNFNFILASSGVGGDPGTGNPGGNPPPAVPLPPAALAGAGMLGLLAARRWVVGKRRLAA